MEKSYYLFPTNTLFIGYKSNTIQTKHLFCRMWANIWLRGSEKGQNEGSKVTQTTNINLTLNLSLNSWNNILFALKINYLECKT